MHSAANRIPQFVRPDANNVFALSSIQLSTIQHTWTALQPFRAEIAADIPLWGMSRNLADSFLITNSPSEFITQYGEETAWSNTVIAIFRANRALRQSPRCFFREDELDPEYTSKINTWHRSAALFISSLLAEHEKNEDDRRIFGMLARRTIVRSHMYFDNYNQPQYKNQKIGMISFNSLFDLDLYFEDIGKPKLSDKDEPWGHHALWWPHLYFEAGQLPNDYDDPSTETAHSVYGTDYEMFNIGRNNFHLNFARGDSSFMSYYMRPCMRRFAREHPNLYRELATRLDFLYLETERSPDINILGPLLFEAFKIISAYTDLYPATKTKYLFG